MRPLEDVAAVLELNAQGFGASAIARRTGIPRGTVRDWVTGRVPKRGSNDGESCEACGGVAHRFGDLPPEYVYLLGLYLGTAASRRTGAASTSSESTSTFDIPASSTHVRTRFAQSTLVDECIG